MLDRLTTNPRATCFHCGESCLAGAPVLDGKSFCCLGCQTVFNLLAENGLDRFYTLNTSPGIRPRVAPASAKWTFLDDPTVREKLLDYADEKQAKVTLHLPAIHCVACIWLLENLFKLHPGIGHSQVNFSRREAMITFNPGAIRLSELVSLLVSIGYEPFLTFGEMEKKVTPSFLGRRSWLQIGIAAFGFGNIMLMSLPLYFGLDSFNGPWFKTIAGWLGLTLALPVVTYSAGDFWRATWLSLRRRTLVLEVPITMGLSAIYLSSVFEVISHRGPGYCDSLCGLIFFLLCGRLFQKKTYDRLTFDRDYKGFFPLCVVRKTPAGEESVALSSLNTSDRLILRNGELLPADAKLIAGEARIDYSFVTGESEPVGRAAGSLLFAGGRQTGGMIEVETIKPVAHSYLATLWDNEAFSKRQDNDLDSLTNQYSRRFTRVVIGVALATAAFWLFKDASNSLKTFISVLIVACPCALALAAPLAQGTAQRLLARLKIYLRNAMVIERMAAVTTVVLDKTGTLTIPGKSGAGFTGSKPLTDAEMNWVGSLARFSTHPNSVRITKFLQFRALPVFGFKETPGCGIEGEVEGHSVSLGSLAWLKKQGCRMSDQSLNAVSVGVAFDGEIRGAFMFENVLRPEVAQLITQLSGRFDTALLSGDNEREMGRFRRVFGEHAILKFNQSPSDKLEFIRGLQECGHKVMMVGDGLNDAGALQQADVGVAVVEQIGTFSPASDVILDATELPRLARVLDFSRGIMRVVRAAFFISGFYNLFGISIAAAGILSPVVCAILMPLSSVTVVVFACGAAMWLGSRILSAAGSGKEKAAGPALIESAATSWRAV